MTIYEQPKKVVFNSFQYENGFLKAQLTTANEENTFDVDQEIAHSELFTYLDQNNLHSITFKSKSTDQHSFICQISRSYIKLKLQSSIKILVYNYNVKVNELFLNKRKVDKSFYTGFLQKLEIIAKKAMLAEVDMIEM